ncbi:hypothetical protein TGAM01_v203430 [Trichoderma gamsii]|uniref:Uncharacterized protein n=1 Tax=Trichoderma gamsii TaxID=398673 RepID=A0A2P4ZTT3_9HYPO|nr:hypothetical protein TGAM01_v203430 [Trichoderma gamsii]PON27663.1 hypothetical protein TGAM01_v203430 [Trichoderma gamsii]
MQLPMLFALLPLASAIPLVQTITDGCEPSTVTVTVTVSSTVSTGTSAPQSDYPPPVYDCIWPYDNCNPFLNRPPPPPTTIASTSTSASAISTPSIDPSCPYGLPFCWPT